MSREAGAQINGVVLRLREGLQEATQDVVLEVRWRIARRTPVDTSRARANWRLGLGRPDRFVDVDARDMTGEDGQAEAREILRGRPILGLLLYITNRLPYIGPLENGSSRKAPLGMVGLTVAELPFICQMARAKLAARLHGRGPGLGT